MIIWPYIFISYLGLFVFGLCDNIRGPLFPEIMKDFGVSDSVGSLMFALSSVSGFVSSHLTRQLLRRYDRLTVLRLGACVVVVAMIGMSLMQNFVLFLICSFFFGLSLGMISLIPNILVPLGSSAERKQQFLSGLHAMYGISSLLSPLLAAAVQWGLGNWRWTFVIAACAPLGLLLYSFHSSHHNLHKKSEVTAADRKQHRKTHFKPLLFLAIMLSFAVAGEVLMSTRLALYVRRVLNYDMESSSFFVTGFFVFMLLGRLVFALVKLPLSIRFQLMMSLIGSITLILAGIHLNPFCLIFVGWTVAPFYPLTVAWISSKFPQDLDSAISFLMMTGSVMLVGMHLLVGKVTDQFGIGQALYLGPVFFFISLILVSTYQMFFENKNS